MNCLAQQTAGLSFSVEPVLFYAFAALVVCSAWAVVVSQNIVRMAVYLLFTLAGAAGLYFLLSAEFLAAIQLIVYAGGTLILIVFGIMLTSKNPFAQLQAHKWERVAGLALGIAMAVLLVVAMLFTRLPVSAATAPGDVPGMGPRQVETIGRALLSTYLVPFEVAGVLLLVVMIGAAYMARRKAN